jgi:uncharacterized protein YdhG (YjbR/CyaY superfamily)
MTSATVPKTIDEYIAAFPPDIQVILERIRKIVRDAAPGAQEKISYRMPAFMQNGILLYCAAFKNHIGLYPPVRGDAKLVADASRYAGEKGNLRLPLDEPIPYDLIRRIVDSRVRQNREKRAAPRPGKRR